jgi:hypothetical protein
MSDANLGPELGTGGADGSVGAAKRGRGRPSGTSGGSRRTKSGAGRSDGKPNAAHAGTAAPDFATLDAAPASKSRRASPDPINDNRPAAEDKPPQLALDPQAVAQRAGILISAHMLFPPFRLTEPEAMALAESQLRVEAVFGVAISPKTQALMAFVGTHAMVYRGKLVNLQAARAQAIAQARAAANPQAFGGGAPNQPWTPPSPPPRGATGPEPTPHTADPGSPPAVASDGGAVVFLHGRTDRPLDYGAA